MQIRTVFLQISAFAYWVTPRSRSHASRVKVAFGLAIGLLEYKLVRCKGAQDARAANDQWSMALFNIFSLGPHRQTDPRLMRFEQG